MTSAKEFEERFWAKVDKSGPCWLWTASTNGCGYGQMWIPNQPKKTMRGAHRVAYELLVGPIPEGLELDHLCRVRRCVNPDHLEAVTHQENAQRSPIMGTPNLANLESGSAKRRAITHCPQGHPYDEENTYHCQGRRECRTCGRRRSNAWKAKRRAA